MAMTVVGGVSSQFTPRGERCHLPSAIYTVHQLHGCVVLYSQVALCCIRTDRGYFGALASLQHMFDRCRCLCTCLTAFQARNYAIFAS